MNDLPLRGVYFAIVTLMYPLFMARVIEALDILGGTDGIMGIDSLPSAWMEQYFIIGMLLLFLFGIRRLVNTDLGLLLRAVKDNDQAVRTSGMNITTYKAFAVCIASAIGCFAGASLVHIYMWAGISTFALDFSVLPIAATVIGGSGTLVGPVIGCLILVPVSELLRDFGTWGWPGCWCRGAAGNDRLLSGDAPLARGVFLWVLLAHVLQTAPGTSAARFLRKL